MSDSDKITAILTAIQIDENLMILLRLMINTNIGNASSAQLDSMVQALGLNT